MLALRLFVYFIIMQTAEFFDTGPVYTTVSTDQTIAKMDIMGTIQLHIVVYSIVAASLLAIIVEVSWWFHSMAVRSYRDKGK